MKIILFLLVSVFCLAFVVHRASAEPKVKLFVVLNTAPDDLGWSYEHDVARLEIEDYFGKGVVETSFTSWVGAGNVTDIVRPVVQQHVASGSNASLLVVLSSNALEASVQSVASQFPNVYVLQMSASKTPTLDNWGAAVSNVYEGFFLAGVMAGRLSAKKKGGLIMGLFVPVTVRSLNAFALGARTVEPNYQVVVALNSRYDDYIRVKKTIGIMSDVHQADFFTGMLSILTIGEAAKMKNQLSVGYPSTLGRVLYGEEVLSSIRMKWFTTYQHFIQKLLDGKWQPREIIDWGLKEDCFTTTSYTTRTPAAVVTEVKSWEEKIRQGYCVFNNVSVGRFYKNASSFDSKGCLTFAERSKFSLFLENITNLGVIPDELIFIEKYVEWDSGTAIALSTIVSLFSFILVMSVLAVIVFTNTVIIMTMNPLFCYSLLLGALMGVTSLFFWMGKPTARLCHARIWFLSVSFCLMFGAISAKTYRMWRIWSNPNIKESDNSNWVLRVFIVVLALAQSALLIGLTATDAYTVERLSDSSLNYDELFVTCTLTGDGVTILALLLGFYGLVVMLSAALAYLSRNVNKKFNELQSVVISIYSTLIASVVIVLLFVNTKTNNPKMQITFMSCGIFIATVFPLCSFFLPKFWFIFRTQSHSKTPTLNTGSSGMNQSSAQL